MSGVADGVSVVIRMVILRVESPEAMRGRIASVNYVFIGASNELGAFESGVAAALFGVVPSIVGGGLMTLGVVGAVAVFAPEAAAAGPWASGCGTGRAHSPWRRWSVGPTSRRRRWTQAWSPRSMRSSA